MNSKTEGAQDHTKKNSISAWFLYFSLWVLSIFGILFFLATGSNFFRADVSQDFSSSTATALVNAFGWQLAYIFFYLPLLSYGALFLYNEISLTQGKPSPLETKKKLAAASRVILSLSLALYAPLSILIIIWNHITYWPAIILCSIFFLSITSFLLSGSLLFALMASKENKVKRKRILSWVHIVSLICIFAIFLSAQINRAHFLHVQKNTSIEMDNLKAFILNNKKLPESNDSALSFSSGAKYEKISDNEFRVCLNKLTMVDYQIQLGYSVRDGGGEVEVSGHDGYGEVLLSANKPCQHLTYEPGRKSKQEKKMEEIEKQRADRDKKEYEKDFSY